MDCPEKNADSGGKQNETKQTYDRQGGHEQSANDDMQVASNSRTTVAGHKANYECTTVADYMP